MTSDHHNTLALQNTRPANPIWFESETIARGGQWTNGTAAGDPATLLQSDDGERLAGAQVGDTVVLFRVEAEASLHEARYWVPSTTRVHIVTGLEPGQSYGLRIQTVGGWSRVTLTAGGATVTTDAAGVAHF